jgi:hypothetical protein
MFERKKKLQIKKVRTKAKIENKKNQSEKIIAFNVILSCLDNSKVDII